MTYKTKVWFSDENENYYTVVFTDNDGNEIDLFDDITKERCELITLALNNLNENNSHMYHI